MFYPLIVLAMVATGPEADCGRIADTTSVSPIGRFSDMRYTEEHAYGSIVELWRAGSCLFGLFQVSEGLAGDTPTGELANVRYDPATGELGFAAKLTIGVTSVKGSNALVPSRDLFRFTGHLGNKVLKGTLQRSNQLRPDMRPVVDDIVSPVSIGGEDFMIQAGTYGEWRNAAQSILQFRGPKW
jgi:hypothetical protein